MARLSFMFIALATALACCSATQPQENQHLIVARATKVATKKTTSTAHKSTSVHKTTSKKSTKTSQAKSTATGKVKIVKPKYTPRQGNTTVGPPGTALISYADWSYASNMTGMYQMWRDKCVHIVGPLGYHHLIRVQEGPKDFTAFVVCYGVPKNPKTQGYYTKSDPWNSTCILGPHIDVTGQEIHKLGVTQLGPQTPNNTPGFC